MCFYRDKLTHAKVILISELIKIKKKNKKNLHLRHGRMH